MMMIVTKVSGGSEERSQPRAALCLQEIAGLETEQAGPPFKLKREAAVFLRCRAPFLRCSHSSLAMVMSQSSQVTRLLCWANWCRRPLTS